MHATLSDLAAFFTQQQYERAVAKGRTPQTFGDLGRHRGGHRHGGRHRGGPIFMGPSYYDPYWIAPSPYLVITTEEDDDNDKDKKKKKIKLGTQFPMYP